MGSLPVHRKARRLLAQRRYGAVIALLEPYVRAQPDGDTHALLALAHFRSEAYASAARHYQAALALIPDRRDRQELLELLALARSNATAEIHVPVPDVYQFDGAHLLAPPQVPSGALPTPPLPGPEPGVLARWHRRLGHVLGAVAAGAMGGVTALWGRLAGYRDEVWTNWYRRPFYLGILTLAYMREQLNARNLKNAYPPGTRVAFQPVGLTPPAGVTHFRTADGSWNNLDDPKEGAAGTRFMRNVNNGAIRRPNQRELLVPNPREISRRLLTRTGPMREVPFLNLLAAAWIQFMTHDWINHGEVQLTEVIAIPLSKDDPARRRYRQSHMFVARTQPDPTRRSDGEVTPITFINEVTHWWDGSQVYGSDQATVDRLRSGVHGKLRLNPDGTLPCDGKGIEETGFTRNWWVGLAMLHTLFVREHNAICDRLRLAYPDWDDTRLFHVSRLINAAVMAKIHTVEWTPAILPNPTLNAALNANWYGLLTNLFRRGQERRTVAAINVRHPELGGVVGNPIDKHGQPFGLTEEFVEVYRLHSLLPETLRLKRLAGGNNQAGAALGAGDDAGFDTEVDVPSVAARQAGSAKLTRRYALADLLYSFGTQHPGQLVLNNYPRFMQELSIPGNPLFDLGAVDILRARERGVPRYNEFRRQLGLNPIRTFADLTRDPHQARALAEVYGSDPDAVERLDLMIGTLAEGHRPPGFGFGETLFQIFILNATRRLQADRFYTDAYNADVYTPEGLQWIDAADFKSVLLRHYPELAGTGLANVDNAFEPWDPGPGLDPQRHPLRAGRR